MTKIVQYDIWLADLNPRFGTEAGKKRPVLIIQTDLLNTLHPSTLICPISTQLIPEAQILRVFLEKNLEKPSDILIDQVRAIDNKRLLKRLGHLTKKQIEQVRSNLKIVLEL